MRYIRTKDGVYKITYDGLCLKEAKSQTMLMLVEHKNEKGKIEYEEITTHKELTMGKHRFKKLIIKQADTIEELCDEAVFFDKDNVPHYKSKEGNTWYLGAGLFTESLRFGIFTDKGLIYVAKMNDKGELELL